LIWPRNCSGDAEWLAAGAALATSRKKPSLEALLARDAKTREALLANKPKIESRIDASDGYAYSKDDFIGLYGGTAEWEAAEPVPSANGNYTPELFDELRKTMGLKGIRMGLDEEYRVDPKEGDVRTRRDFVMIYGSMVGVERWEAAKFGEEPYSGELQPQVGDQILFKSKGSNLIEGTVLKRVEGMRLRVETTEEWWDEYKQVYEVKQTWTQVKDVVKIVAKFEAQCDNFRINVLAVEFGRCKVGLKLYWFSMSSNFPYIKLRVLRSVAARKPSTTKRRCVESPVFIAKLIFHQLPLRAN
jgi:hypothetical protein